MTEKKPSVTCKWLKDETILVNDDPSRLDSVPVSWEASRFVILLPSPANAVAVSIPLTALNVNAVLVLHA